MAPVDAARLARANLLIALGTLILSSGGTLQGVIGHDEAFALSLAIGIVVDDAIVVVEAVIHHLEHGLGPREATIKAMEEVTAPDAEA